MGVFLTYFGLPAGAVWGNVAAEPVCVALAGLVAYLLRHKIGHALAGWWHHHNAERMEEEIDRRAHKLAHEIIRDLDALSERHGR